MRDSSGFAWPMGLLGIALIVLLAWYTTGNSGWRYQAPAPQPVRLLSVSDGDSVRLSVDGSPAKFRLATVDAPEHDQPYGHESRNCLRSILDQGQLTAVIHKTDKYGRLIGDLFVDGARVDVSLVEQGCAWWYSRYAPANVSLIRAHYAAMEAGVGLWQDSRAIAPEDWRRGVR
jgi:endonuclease YncB( thermonuclease family)